MRLSKILDESVVKVGLESEDGEEVIEELVQLLVDAGRMEDRNAVVEAIRAREKVITVAIGAGVAVPHAIHPSIANLSVVLGISRQGIEYDSVDGQPVHVVLLGLSAPGEATSRVACQAEFARLMMLPGFCDQLRDAESPADVLHLIREAE